MPISRTAAMSRILTINDALSKLINDLELVESEKFSDDAVDAARALEDVKNSLLDVRDELANGSN